MSYGRARAADTCSGQAQAEELSQFAKISYTLCDMQAAAKQVTDSHGHLNLLLNCAGILHVPGVMSPGKLWHSFACMCHRITAEQNVLITYPLPS